ncbi:unnamed protein product, partial [Discosporangium mesarthrocarpum]
MTGLAARAQACYSNGQYEEAIALLSQSLMMAGEGGDDGGNDLRVLHNLALAEHASRGFKDPAKLEQDLLNIRKKMREKGRGDPVVEVDGEATGEDKALGRVGAAGAIMGYSSAVAASATEGLSDLDADASVLLYNLAALHFQQKQYGAARAVLEYLFLHIEPLDEPLAIHICFLLLDVLCHSARGSLHDERSLRAFAQQTFAVVGFLERTHAHSSESGGSSGGGAGGGESKQDDGALSSSGSAEQTEFSFRLHLYKAKLLLLQLQVEQSSKKEIKSALEIFQRKLREPNEAGSGSGGGGGAGGAGGAGGGGEAVSTGGGGVGGQGTFSPVPPAGVQNMAALYLKANLEHLRDNQRKALKLLASCHGIQGAEEFSGQGEPTGPPYFNNMGCLHHKLGRHHVALHYFQQALALMAEAESGAGAGAGAGAGSGGKTRRQGSPDRAEGKVAPSWACEVLYNTGLQLLLTNNPEEALRCFERSALLFYNRPCLWLRVAECGILRHRLDLKSKVTPSRSGAGAGAAAEAGTRTASPPPPPALGPAPTAGAVTAAPGAPVPGGSGAAPCSGKSKGDLEAGPLTRGAVGNNASRRVLLPVSRLEEPVP